mgnify:CR=1 FL=1
MSDVVPSITDPKNYLETNIIGTINTVEQPNITTLSGLKHIGSQNENVTINGNLTLNGNLSMPSGITNVTAQSVNTTQTLIKLGDQNNVGDAVNIGFYGNNVKF